MLSIIFQMDEMPLKKARLFLMWVCLEKFFEENPDSTTTNTLV